MKDATWATAIKLFLNIPRHTTYIMQDMVTIERAEYEMLKKQSKIDVELLEQFLESFRDIKEGRIRRVK